MKTILKIGTLPDDTVRYVGECSLCGSIYSGTADDIAKVAIDGTSWHEDPNCNICNRATVLWFVDTHETGIAILSKVHNK